MNDLLWGYSKALYATWLFYRPDNLLIDCGEGAATTLGNGGYGVERVFLTHGHVDHIAGLPVLLWSRASGMGDVDKTLTIYYPRGDELVAQMKNYLHSARANWPFELRWHELSPGDTIDLTAPNQSHARRIEAFATHHIRGQLTLGYKICEARRRLRAPWNSWPKNQVQDLARELAHQSGAKGPRELSEDYLAPLIAWSGDSGPLNVETVRDCEILCHEATILEAETRKGRTHSTLDEALEVAQNAQVKTLLLYHFSGRYRSSEIRRAVQNLADTRKLKCAVWCLIRDRLQPVWPAEPIALQEETHEKP